MNRIIGFNEELKKRPKNNKNIGYDPDRFIPTYTIKSLNRLPGCAKKYYFKTDNLVLTAAYYLKNIIVLQAFSDGNHRTAIYITKFFLESNGCITKRIDDECYLKFRKRLIMWREKDYYTVGSLGSKVLKFEDNISTEESYVFNFCLKFIKKEMLR